MKPDFFCIGMQKAGTTWLYENLKSHPRITAALLKEPHYLDNVHYWPAVFRQQNLPYYSAFAVGEVRRTIIENLAWVADCLLNDLGKDPLIDMRRVSWIRSVVGLGEDILSEAWYQRVFSITPPGYLVGDFTADTYLLDSAAILQIRRQWPEAKFIMLLRDPVERDWSQLRMLLGSSASDAVADGLASPQMLGRHLYSEIINRWVLGVDEARIHFDFYDDIRRDPQGLLDRVVRFLGIGPHPDGWQNAQSIEFEGPDVALTDEARALLIERNRDALEFLSARFGEPCARWRRKYLGEEGA